MGFSKNRGTPKSSIFNRVFHYKPSILGYPYFWKHPDCEGLSHKNHRKPLSLQNTSFGPKALIWDAQQNLGT